MGMFDGLFGKKKDETAEKELREEKIEVSPVEEMAKPEKAEILNTKINDFTTLLWKYRTGNYVEDVSVSADGNHVAAWSRDKHVYFFNCDGELLWKYKTGSRVYGVHGVSASDDGDYVAAGSLDKHVYFFNCDGELLWKYRTGNEIKGISVSADGGYVAAGSKDDHVYFFNRDGELLWKHKTGNRVHGISVSADGGYVAAGSLDKHVYFFSRRGKLLWKHETDVSVHGVSVSADGGYIAAGSKDKRIYFFKSDIPHTNALESIKSSETATKAATNAVKEFGCDVGEPEKLLSEARSRFEEGDYYNAVKLAERAEEIARKIEKIKDSAKPEIEIDLLTKSFKPDYWDEASLVVKNVGNTHAKGVKVSFSKEVEVRQIVEFDLSSNEEKEINFLLKPVDQGEVPIDVTISFSDPEGTKYVVDKSFMINVEVAESEKKQPTSPAAFTPRPTGTTTFPIELEDVYYDPEFVGKGGFARVFKARRKRDDKVVAVKVPLSLDASTGKSFVREITVWQGLKHENIIELYDLNVLPIPYLELEYAENRSLEELGKPLDVDLAARIIFDAGEGLRYTHEKGIIHRDLKPQNILLAADLSPKIADWGLSKVMADSKTSSRYGFSPVYASPEQISPKKFGTPDKRTDIYQMGVVFYELVTGTLPFEGDDMMDIISQIMNDDPADPSSVNPDAGEVEAIILKCLSKRKEDRYQSMEELQKELGRYLKIEYKKSLKESRTEHNMKRSAHYCCELFMVHVKLNEPADALKYCMDMQNYAGNDEIRAEIESLVKELKIRLEKDIGISEEFMDKAKVLAHQVRMGRG